MNLGFIKPTVLAIRNFAIDHSTTILTSIGVAGIIGTAVSASVASVKSYKKIQEVETETGEKLVPKEKVKLCWKYYIPPVAIGAVTIGSTIGSSIISGKREAAMASALALAKESFDEYKDEIAARLSPEEEKEIQDKVIFDKIANTNSEEINPEWTYCRHGDVLCYDYYCGRYFYSDPSFLRSCEAEINRQFLTEGVVYLDDIYAEIDLISANRPWLSRMVTWEVGDDVISRGGTLEFVFQSTLTSDNKPVLVVRMNRDPVLTNYDS